MAAGVLGALGEADNGNLVFRRGRRALVAVGVGKVHVAARRGHDALDVLALPADDVKVLLRRHFHLAGGVVWLGLRVSEVGRCLGSKRGR